MPTHFFSGRLSHFDSSHIIQNFIKNAKSLWTADSIKQLPLSILALCLSSQDKMQYLEINSIQHLIFTEYYCSSYNYVGHEMHTLQLITVLC